MDYVVWPGMTDFAQSNFKFTTLANPLEVKKTGNFSGNLSLGLGYKVKNLGFGIKLGCASGSANRILIENHVPTNNVNQPLRETRWKNTYYFPNRYFSISNSLFAEYHIYPFLISIESKVDWSGFQPEYETFLQASSRTDGVMRNQRIYYFPGHYLFGTFFISSTAKLGWKMDKSGNSILNVGLSARKLFFKNKESYSPFGIDYTDFIGNSELGFSEFRETFKGLGFVVGLEKRLNWKNHGK